MNTETVGTKPLHQRDIGRLNAFTDGIIVVSMTLLVIDVRLPEHLANHDGVALLHALAELWPKFFGYMLSFVVIASYWVGYTDRFGEMKVADVRFVQLNILFLLVIGFIPFTTSMISTNDGSVATSLYALNMIMVCVMLCAMWIYALRHNMVADIGGTLFQQILPWVQTAAVFAASIVMAQFSPAAGKLTWLLLALPLPKRWRGPAGLS
jgi:uncharacterized membrane protein